MLFRWTGLLVLLTAVCFTASCAVQTRITSNSLDFLYPSGALAEPATDIELQLPVRVGVAFAPTAAAWQESLPELQKQVLLDKVADAFREREGLSAVEVVPALYLKPGGGYENLDRVVSALGIDVIALISYDQFQFSDTTRKSWAYWTVVGAYLVKGEKNETRTLMDATVVHIKSRAIMFNASGQNRIEGKATPIDMSKEMRRAGEQGFEEATADLIVNLKTALDAFEVQAATGTIRGQGTPAISMVDSSGNQVTSTGGGGSVGWLELAALLCLLAVGLRFKQAV